MFQKGLAPILIVLILAGVTLLVGGGYYLGTKRSETLDTHPAPSGAGETANWKSYENKKFGFSFKYPQQIFKYSTQEYTDDSILEFKLAPEEIQQNGTSKQGGFPQFALTVTAYSYKETLETFLNEKTNQDNYKDSNKIKFNIENNEGVKILRYPKALEVPGTYNYDVFIRHGSFMYYFNLNSTQEKLILDSKSYLDNLIQTIKFLQ